MTVSKSDRVAQLGIYFAATVVGTLAFMYLDNKLADMDSMRELYMRTCLLGKRVSQAQADFWQANAGKCATAYQKVTL